MLTSGEQDPASQIVHGVAAPETLSSGCELRPNRAAHVASRDPICAPLSFRSFTRYMPQVQLSHHGDC